MAVFKQAPEASQSGAELDALVALVTGADVRIAAAILGFIVLLYLVRQAYRSRTSRTRRIRRLRRLDEVMPYARADPD